MFTRSSALYLTAALRLSSRLPPPGGRTGAGPPLFQFHLSLADLKIIVLQKKRKKEKEKKDWPLKKKETQKLP